MEMTENPKLDLASSYDNGGSESQDKKISTQKKLISDHLNSDTSDSFVIDMESFIHGGSNKDGNPNSRITFQRSLSRKGSMRGANDNRDTSVSNSSSTGGSPEKLTAVAEKSTDHSINPQIHHQMITITSSNINAATESRFSLKRNSFRRSSPPWLLDPKRILLFFATLSSMGTILLIYFTLSIRGTNQDVNALD